MNTINIYQSVNRHRFSSSLCQHHRPVYVCAWCQCDVTIIIKLSCASVIQLILKFSVWLWTDEYFPLTSTNTHTYTNWFIHLPLSLVVFLSMSAHLLAFVFVFVFAFAFIPTTTTCPFLVCVLYIISFDLKVTGIIG